MSKQCYYCGHFCMSTPYYNLTIKNEKSKHVVCEDCHECYYKPTNIDFKKYPDLNKFTFSKETNLFMIRDNLYKINMTDKQLKSELAKYKSVKELFKKNKMARVHKIHFYDIKGYL